MFGRVWRGGLTALLGGAAMGWTLSSGNPVALQPDELLHVLGWVALAPALVGALAALLVKSRWGAIGAGLVPLAALAVLAALSPDAALGTWPDLDLRFRVVGGAMLALLALRSRFAPGIAAVLAVGLVGLIGWMAPPLGNLSSGSDRLVVLVTLDTVRGDAFSFNRVDAEAHTPALAALAATSTVFREAHSPMGLTGPAHTSLLSGLDPLDHGVLGNGESVDADVPWLPSELQDAGWTTRAYVSASVLDAHLGFGRGFEVFDSTFRDRVARGHPLFRFLGYRNLPGSAHSRPGADTLQLVDLEPEGPTFVWVHLYDAHWPYEPSLEAAERQGLDEVLEIPEALRTAVDHEAAYQERGRRQYLAELEDLDALVGGLVERLPGGATLVVVGDHGEAMGENGRFFAHGHDSRHAISHVPLLIHGPGWQRTVVDTPVGTARVADTLRAICGLDAAAPLSGDAAVVSAVVSAVAMRSGLTLIGRVDDRFINGTVRDARGAATVFDDGKSEGSEALLPDAHRLAEQAGTTSSTPPEPTMAAALEALGYVD